MLDSVIFFQLSSFDYIRRNQNGLYANGNLQRKRMMPFDFCKCMAMCSREQRSINLHERELSFEVISFASEIGAAQRPAG